MKSFITKNLGAFFKSKPETEVKKNPTPTICSGKQLTLTPDLFNRKLPETQLQKERLYSAKEVAEMIRKSK